ncbi:DUF1801 domain-containing protein [Roseibium sp. SCP14]|uniref:DUF1801 domain-containing protein n=1 Tax=Roseibium sp. SCP14 TaxID=3141375 RepID=UPI003338769B
MKGNPAVLALLDSYPEALRSALATLRQIILETAEENAEVGELEETLKWGQPSYLTVRPKSGTTVRIDRDKSALGDYALYVNCQSSLVSDWRTLFPELAFGGDRSVHFKLEEPFPEQAVRHMIAMALTYHSRKRKPQSK